MLSLASASTAAAPPAPPGSCQRFSDIFTDGEDLIERLWDHAFLYTPDEQLGYTMWWHEGGAAGTADAHANPNDLVTQSRNGSVPTECLLDLSLIHI